MDAIGIPSKFGGYEPDLIVSGLGIEGLVVFTLNLFFLVNVFLAFVFLMYAGIQFITASGDVGKLAKARKAITGSAVGLVLSILSLALIWILKKFLGIDFPLL